MTRDEAEELSGIILEFDDSILFTMKEVRSDEDVNKGLDKYTLKVVNMTYLTIGYMSEEGVAKIARGEESEKHKIIGKLDKKYFTVESMK